MSALPSPSAGSISGLPPSPTSSSASATSTSGGSSGSTSDATLYLYTFLATLVLLLAVSSAIVIRSLILRRRHQRLVEEAIRTGTWMPHRLDSSTGRRRRDIGQKPKLWEAWLHSEDDVESESEKSKWGDIMPVYAAYVNVPASSPQGPVSDPAENSMDPLSRAPRFIRSFPRRRSPPAPQSSAIPPIDGHALSLPSSSPTSTPTPAVRVAVLIAMPSPPQRQVSSDENGPPVVEIGVVEASIKDIETETPTP